VADAHSFVGTATDKCRADLQWPGRAGRGASAQLRLHYPPPLGPCDQVTVSSGHDVDEEERHEAGTDRLEG
jgi:hypothetical protein